MANGQVINSVEHWGLSPEQYSVKPELVEYNGLRKFSNAIPEQTYLQSSYTGLEYKDYAGIVYIVPPNPIYIPSRSRYDGIAPMNLMPSINPPYPYDPGQYNAY